MKQIGKYIFPIPFLVFGVLHLLNGTTMSGMVPSWLPGGVFWVYVSGIGMITFALSAYVGKYDKTAARLLALMLLIFILTIHVPSLGSSPMALMSLLKDLGLMAGAMMFSEAFAKGK